MAAKEKIEACFDKSGPFKEGIGKLRSIALGCGLEESLKWNAPVYTQEGKNIVGILSFKIIPLIAKGSGLNDRYQK
jgi:uncharacterized protein YdeI (YjbR/CyaY-like superfamily)